MDQIQKFGFDLINTFKKYVLVMKFLHFKKYASGYPMFCHGILSTNGEGTVSKGDTLTSFLKHAGPYYHCKTQKPGYYPKVIILVDDKKKQLKNVEESLEAYKSIHSIHWN